MASALLRGRFRTARLATALFAPVPSSQRFFVTTNVLLQQRAPEARSTEPPPAEPAADASAEAESGDPKDTRIRELSDELGKLKAVVAEQNSTRMRLLAEMENVRTIAKRDVENAKNYSVQSLAKRLLEVVDNLQRAVDAVPPSLRVSDQRDGFGVLYEGVLATERDFLKTLGQFGITSFGEAGEKFDYNKHEAMVQVPAAPGQAANVVAQVLKRGFSMKDRVLRPAQVTITVAPTQ